MNFSEPGIWVAIAAAILGCFFSVCNIAMRSYSRSRLSEFFEDRDQDELFTTFHDRVRAILLMVATGRVALNLILLVALSSVFGGANPELSVTEVSLRALLVAGILIMIFGVAIPHTWGHYAPEKILLFAARPLLALNWIATPVVRVLSLFDPVVRRLVGVDEDRDEETVNEEIKDEVLSAVEEHDIDGSVGEDQKEMLEAVIELPTTSVGQIMTPRTDVRGISSDADLEEIKAAIIRDGHSRIPVYRENLDQIEGILYAKDLIRFLGNDLKLDLVNQVRPAMLVPETKPVSELLKEFKARKVHIAIVLDEYGGTAGLITIEDILEEIVGEIEDEYEPVGKTKPGIRRIDDHTAEVDARVAIDDLNDELDLELPEDDDFETVGGFVLSELGRVPETGESFAYEDLKVTVTDAEPNRVTAVRIEQAADPATIDAKR